MTKLLIRTKIFKEICGTHSSAV